eukprot:scaffold1350_cov56-Cyclotella_meneghiniana.AAC.22
MPSRKKAQGKARKEKKQAAKLSNILHVDSGTQACRHCSQQIKDWSRGDVDTAEKLAKKYLAKCNAIKIKDTEQASADLDRLSNEIYVEYRQLNDDGKEFFKEIMVSNGTAAVVARAKQIDLSKVSIRGAWPYIFMILVLEVRNRYSGAIEVKILNEIEMSMDDIVGCPREIVRFFHRRNSCNCLKDLYYKLKETTKRTSLCWHCMHVFDIRAMNRCRHCQVAQYCSYECAVANWSEHKSECRVWRLCQETEETEL